MQKVRKICLRITTGRIVATILMVASAVNLMIVGAAFEVTFPPSTSNETSAPNDPFSTITFSVPTATAGAIFTSTPEPVDTYTPRPSVVPTGTFTATNTASETPSDTPTATFTFAPTNTPTPTPSLVPCIVRYSWPIYIIQPNDTLFSLARDTYSTVEELMWANCLSNDYIYTGQLLYVPRLPIKTPTLTPTDAFACVEFEDLKLGTTYKVGEAFVSSGVGLAVEPFAWGNGTQTSSGFVYVSDRKAAGGFGNELQVNNVNIIFNLGALPSSLSLLFGEYGGNLNININGDFRNFDNFADIDRYIIGGVQVSVLKGFGNDAGFLQLSGTIKSFLVGGQELWIDNVCLNR